LLLYSVNIENARGVVGVRKTGKVAIQCNVGGVWRGRGVRGGVRVKEGWRCQMCRIEGEMGREGVKGSRLGGEGAGRKGRGPRTGDISGPIHRFLKRLYNL